MIKLFRITLFILISCNLTYGQNSSHKKNHAKFYLSVQKYYDSFEAAGIIGGNDFTTVQELAEYLKKEPELAKLVWLCDKEIANTSPDSQPIFISVIMTPEEAFIIKAKI